MKKRKTVLVFLSIFLLLCVLSGIYDRQLAKRELRIKEMPKETEMKEKEAQQTLGVEETIQAFAEVVFTYNTAERLYYEGAEVFMTENAYDALIPSPNLDDEAEIEDVPVVQMTSELQELQCFYRTGEDGETEVIAEIWYTLSGTGEFRIRQLAKLKLIKQDGWKIDEYTVLDTLEQ